MLGISSSEPAGKPLSDCQMKTAVVTLDAGKEDDDIRNKYGLVSLRQVRLSRIVHEALDQGISLTQEDLAFKLLNCSIRTVRRDINEHIQSSVNPYLPISGTNTTPPYFLMNCSVHIIFHKFL
ncbi:MAG: DUF1670 domain-containing protein [ANME-2 cluster archaeon]|nr:DUF1670 domain-containing protein [ANME-2 cluster archaeon]MBC2701396.1 DUF1670 domain-containing protein [ANME-2 cluster archaeon]MBC2707016.1 DUF1670 domain-containing protein [ANME-2 cluster archaeon]MBC2746078.1 DUF1670 domain-containing protein [ANME-2 cluster archaeon]